MDQAGHGSRMFEEYTVNARRVIFYARYEAGESGCCSIDTDHLLLGVLREANKIIAKYLGSIADYESIREDITRQTPKREKIPKSIDMQLTEDCKRVLGYAGEEAELLRDNYIRPEHLLLGLMREEKFVSASLLHQRGLRASVLREELARISAQSADKDGETGT